MSYNNPDIVINPSPEGIDIPINSIQDDLSALVWLTRSFGRAWEFSERLPTGRTVKVPKVYDGEGEYLNVLPNDFLTFYSFIMCNGPEKWTEFTRGLSNPKTRKLSIFFWGNLKEVTEGDYIQTEALKKEVEAILKQNSYIQSIDSYVDEKAEEVFKGYVSSGSGTLSTTDDDANQFLMCPYGGFRFDITVFYYDNC